MKRIWLGVLAGLICSASCALLPAAVHAQSESTEAETAQIHKVIDGFVDAFNRHDAHGWAMPFLEDGDFMNVTGLTRHGRAEVEERFKGLFAGSLKNA
ncbi:MAG: YybH family protein, partial [Candidatus Acidiferrales bacterium]